MSVKKLLLAFPFHEKVPGAGTTADFAINDVFHFKVALNS
jgi:hypothetical protein